jgi:hypothetical protein
MKILITGMTGANVRGQMMKTGVYTQSHMYREGLKDLGYEVTNAPPSEHDIAGQVANHDMFLIGLAPVGSITAGWRIHLLAMVGRILLEGKPIVTFIDDWQFQGILPGLENLLEDDKVRRMFDRDVKMARVGHEFYDTWETEIKIGLNYLCSREHVMLASFMDFGHSNDAYYALTENPVFIDVSCYQPIPDIPSGIRYKQWVIAGLADYTAYADRLNCEWPIVHVGGKVDGKFKSQKEAQVFLAYSKSKGMLIPTYKSSNTNWWRPRYLFARKYRNLIYAEPPSTGKYTIFNIAVSKLEHMSSVDLNATIQEQMDILDDIIWTKEKFLKVLKDVILSVS